MDIFRVRLNCIDHYQATPSKYDPVLRNDIRSSQLSKEPKVPVIRIFGSTETGQKVCAHIHGAFPYLYIEYTGSPEDVGPFILRLHLSIDHALAVHTQRNTYRQQHRFVARITLVKAVPFYGFHVGYRLFLKIYMLDPGVMTRLADLLREGLVMGCKFQPYEAHLQYLLQFMADYNLYGCAYVDTDKAQFRAPVPEFPDDGDDGDVSAHRWHKRSIPRRRITDDDPSLPRASHCPVEVDVCVQDILNRRSVEERPLHHDFVERTCPLPPDVKLVHSMAELWRDEARRRRQRAGEVSSLSGGSLFSSEETLFPPEALISMSADPRDSLPSGWVHEDEHRQALRELITREEAEDEAEGRAPPSFETFVQQPSMAGTVKTALQSVEDLFPENLFSTIDPQQSQEVDEDLSGSIIVDEEGIRGLDDVDMEDLLPDDSDEERAVEATRKTGADGEGLQDDIPSVLGVCLSGQRLGHAPQMPLYPELVLAADAGDLVSRNSGLVRDPGPVLGVAPKPSLKRCQGPEEDHEKRVKRARFEQRGAEKSSLDAMPRVEIRTPSSNNGKGTVSDARQPALPFPVVKDPEDPDTRLRLSQQSSSQKDGPTATDGSGSSAIEKEVSFMSSPASSDMLHSTSEALAELAALHGVAEYPPAEAPPFEPPPMQQGVTESNPPAKFTSPPSPSPLQHRTAGSSSSTAWDSRVMGSPMATPPALHMIPVVATPPPSAAEVVASMRDYGVPDVIYQDAFYSKEKDVPKRPREYAGREFRLEGNTVPYLPDFDATGQPMARPDYERQRRQCTIKSWEIADPPPSADEVKLWARQVGLGREADQQRREADQQESGQPQPAAKTEQTRATAYSQIDGPTPLNKHGFKFSQRQVSTRARRETQYMSTMSMELHVQTRGDLVPNPEEDEVQCVFWSVKTGDAFRSGVIVLSEDGLLARQVRRQVAADTEVAAEATELDVMVRMVSTVRTNDPDILTGYEVHGGSWGYLAERAALKYDYDLYDEFSRMRAPALKRPGTNRWNVRTTSTVQVAGRHTINIWRAMRGQLDLLQYTMENVAWHLLHRRVPHYSWRTLTGWWDSGSGDGGNDSRRRRPQDLGKVLRYHLARARLDLEILDASELVARTSEQARLLGVDFFSVMSRGSQFKVESILFRIAKPENLVLVSPSRRQVGGQKALECLPLVMEPQSAFYNSPVVVLDFQSLYPSLVIAYNYCYSTYLGRLDGSRKMGFAEYRRREGLLRLLEEQGINVAPNGAMYVRPEVRRSVLGRMLGELLETRVMVKGGMRAAGSDDRDLHRLLDNRQLALKLLANVTYGYASASFSGRMPCAELADSIVQTGRETLERAAALIHTEERWGAEVVYGDTDSLFVLLRGRTREQAFGIGEEMARAVTESNPRPVRLRFEKVYQPCVLLAKKRYVGYKYESREQTVPIFDAKGTETVRRDGTPAEQKIEEKALRLLFETADLSRVKAYFVAQCAKIMRGAVSVQDFCFAKEVRLGTYSSTGRAPPPPAVVVSTRRMQRDARTEPQYGERVPYVVAAGAPGDRLVDRCMAPEELVHDPLRALDADYYIGRNLIPPLERIFCLVGASPRQWYDEMPKVQRARPVVGGAGGRTLESYMQPTTCTACGRRGAENAGSRRNTGSRGVGSGGALCKRCRRDAAGTITRLRTRLAAQETKLADVVRVCQSCSGMAPLDGDVACDSRDCPVFYTRAKQATALQTDRAVMGPVIDRLERGALEW